MSPRNNTCSSERPFAGTLMCVLSGKILSKTLWEALEKLEPGQREALVMELPDSHMARRRKPVDLRRARLRAE
jgi:hypothetical protein